jgi:DNA-binding IclR family transcriptional regulator
MGYATYDDIILDRTTSALGVPVCDPDGHPVAGIGTTYITGWLTEKQREACLERMRDSAERISRRLFAREGAAH